MYLTEKSKRAPLRVGKEADPTPFTCGDEDLRRNAFSHIFPNLESEKRCRKPESVEGQLRTRLMHSGLIQVKQ